MENLSIAFSFMLEVEHIPLVNIGKHTMCVTMMMVCFVGLWNSCFIYRQVKGIQEVITLLSFSVVLMSVLMSFILLQPQ